MGVCIWQGSPKKPGSGAGLIQNNLVNQEDLLDFVRTRNRVVLAQHAAWFDAMQAQLPVQHSTPWPRQFVFFWHDMLQDAGADSFVVSATVADLLSYFHAPDETAADIRLRGRGGRDFCGPRERAAQLEAYLAQAGEGVAVVAGIWALYAWRLRTSLAVAFYYPAIIAVSFLLAFHSLGQHISGRAAWKGRRV